MKIISIVGTRPQFLKLTPLIKEFKNHPHIIHKILHTGQHMDKEMSDDIFKLLELEQPDYNLNINCKSHGELTGLMLIEIEKILIEEQPKYVLVYGDCDTTLAGAIAAVKLHIKCVHIESGLRSYNKNMPEEINRIMVDHVADILCCPTEYAKDNLIKEGIKDNIFITGNLQIDLLKDIIGKYNRLDILNKNNLDVNNFILLTIHRDYNTNENSLIIIFNQLEKLNLKIFFPVHPRTRKIIINSKISVPKNIILDKPVNYLDMTILERHCKYIITDSGGIQAEAFYLKKKCFTIRTETEWIDTLENNWNQLVDINEIYDTIKNNDYDKNKTVINNDELNCSLNIFNLMLLVD